MVGLVGLLALWLELLIGPPQDLFNMFGPIDSKLVDRFLDLLF